jgi:hypothetical protein
MAAEAPAYPVRTSWDIHLEMMREFFALISESERQRWIDLIESRTPVCQPIAAFAWKMG